MKYLRISIISLALASFGFCALPPESTQLLQRLKEFETAEQAKAAQAISEKRAAVVKTLRTQLEAETKKGNLDAALEIKNIIAGLEPKDAPTAAPETTGATPKIPEDAFKGRKSYYLVVITPKPVTWTYANAECEKMGGKLATADEMRELTRYFGTISDKLAAVKGFWVGARKSQEDGKIRWLNGNLADPDRFRWPGNEKRMNKDEYQYVALNINGALLLENDRAFDHYSAFICEWPREK